MCEINTTEKWFVFLKMAQDFVWLISLFVYFVFGFNSNRALAKIY